ncbi:hypothetical protein ACET3Z_014350 [Daucus carota]
MGVANKRYGVSIDGWKNRGSFLMTVVLVVWGGANVVVGWGEGLQIEVATRRGEGSEAVQGREKEGVHGTMEGYSRVGEGENMGGCE